MADALKTFFSPALVKRLARSLHDVAPSFPADAFVRQATKGLDDLELLARGQHIATALHTHLPKRYEDAVDVLVRSLGEKYTGEDVEGGGMAPFFYLPHTRFVATYGLDDFDVSMQAQYELTQRFTCEFSIRPFLERYPNETLAVLKRWAKDRSPHVRRLVSEGTRPLLPWAARVSWIQQEPERVLPLLEQLKDDPSSYVRRSVANHLNDLSKTRSDMVCAIARRWLDGATPERQALVKHALRSAVKKGNLTALGLLGYGAVPKVEITNVSYAPRRVAIGGKTKIAFSLHSATPRTQSLAVDLIVHFIKAKGHASPKVFKVAALTIGPRETATVAKTVSLAVHTTRKPNIGDHRVEALINGKRFDLGSFVVTR